MSQRFFLAILFLLGVLVSLTPQFAAAEERQAPEQLVNVAGNWQISWEARIGTEMATVRFLQDDAKLSGVFHGQLGSPAVAGTVDGKKVSFTFEFTGKYPFTLAFAGLLENDKMSGKFEVRGVASGYDPHGENARPTDYSWKASRLADENGQSAKNQPPDETAR